MKTKKIVVVVIIMINIKLIYYTTKTQVLLDNEKNGRRKIKVEENYRFKHSIGRENQKQEQRRDLSKKH